MENFLLQVGLSVKDLFPLKEIVASINVYYHFAIENLK